MERIGLSGPEKMFWDEMAAIGADIPDAYIERAKRDWSHDVYIFRMIKADGAEHVGSIRWDLNAFPELLKLAKGE